MTTQMSLREIEGRLRLAAPDEPAVLPPLVLPALDRQGRVTATVRFRGRAAAPGNPRLAFAMVALAFAAAAVVVAGSLYFLNNRSTLTNQLRWPPAEGVLGIQDGFTMEWPDSWHVLAEGGLSQGDFTQTGISYERVALIVASDTLAGCATPGASNGPLVVPSGSTEIPGERADAAVACLRTATLPTGAIRVTAEVGERTRGLFAADGPAIADTSEPTPESGWSELVDGQPARLTVMNSPDADAVGVAEIRTWDVIFPGTIDHVLRIRADIAGPDLAAGRTAVQAVINSIEFAADPPVLEPASAGPALVSWIDGLDRSSREQRSDFYACYPREPGTSDGTISAGLGEQLASPVPVTCTTTIVASVIGAWRITLTTRWPAGDGYPAGGIAQEFFVRGDGSSTGGSVSYRLDESGVPQLDAEASLPQARRDLPAPLEAPIGLTAGSFVELLWPGIYPSDRPGDTSSDLYPTAVGWSLYVIDGPRMIDGQEWYPVQWDEGSFVTTKWVPAVRDGRPTIASVEPPCPTGDIDLEALMWLTAAERLACLGSRELTFEPVTLTQSQQGGVLCQGPEPDSDPTACPDDGTVNWLEADPSLLLYGARGPNGPVPGLATWFDPASAGAVPTSMWLRIHGHFDDGSAGECRRGPFGAAAISEDELRDAVLTCRERFVVTGFEEVPAP